MAKAPPFTKKKGDDAKKGDDKKKDNMPPWLKGKDDKKSKDKK